MAGGDGSRAGGGPFDRGQLPGGRWWDVAAGGWRTPAAALRQMPAPPTLPAPATGANDEETATVTFRPDELVSGLPSPFDARGSSFVETLRRYAPEAVPPVLDGAVLPESLRDQLVHGTTVLAVVARDGVVMAGDGRQPDLPG
jgi:hypothetical protein